MRQLLTQKKGLTLVELLLSLAILAIVVLPFSSIFLNSTRIDSTSSDYMKATQLAQQLLEEYKNNSYGIAEEFINDEGTAFPVAYTERTEGRLKAYVYFFEFKSINEYQADESGLPDSFDFEARLEESGSEDMVFYYKNNGSETFGPDSYDVIDSSGSSELNLKLLQLEKLDEDTVRVSISRSGEEPLEAELEMKPGSDAYSFRLECFGEYDGSNVRYQIVNESGHPLNVYRIDNLTIDENGKVEINKNKVGISVLSGKVAIKNNSLSASLASGVHYKLQVVVQDAAGKRLVELYGITR